MKFVAVSDTHLQSGVQVPDGDVLLHAGDATFRGTLQELSEFNKWIGSLPHKFKIFVPGNHDWLCQTDPALAKSVLSNVIYLQDDLVVLNGVCIYGSPWQPEFGRWAFNLPRGESLAQKWKLIPKETDILVTHGPPLGYGDWVRNEHVGCWDLAQAVRKQVKPAYHVFGHIHEGAGVFSDGTTTYINAAICDRAYAAVQPARTFEFSAPVA